LNFDLSGITKYNTHSGKTVDYDMGDGLQSNEFNAGSFLNTGKVNLFSVEPMGSIFLLPTKLEKEMTNRRCSFQG